MSAIVRGDCMPTITLEECVNGDTDMRGNWVQLDDITLVDMFSSVIVENQQEELGAEFAFHKVRDEEFYEERFPGFDPSVYTILANEQKRLDEERNKETKKVFEKVDEMQNEIVELSKNINDLAIAMGK
jgi:hypothetical protein